MTARVAAPRGRWRAAAVVALGVLGLLVGGPAAPASAHGRGSDATNFASRIAETPPLPDLHWAVHGGDELLELVNRGDAEVLVLGYEGEPYLRVGPEGVWENRRSPATYLNTDRYAQAGVPADASADAEPAWEQVSDGSRYAWHDHRIHWMSPTLPPSVSDPATETVVTEMQSWTVPVVVGGETYEVVGELRWVPGPSRWLWLLATLPVALLALAGLRTRPEVVPARPPDAAGEEPGAAGEEPGAAAAMRWPGLARPAAALLLVVVALNTTQLVDDLFAVPLPASTRALAASQTLLFLGIAVFGALRAWQAGDGAFTALGVASGAVLVGQGLLYWTALGVSQLATMFPDWLARATVSLSITQAVAIGAVVVVGTRRLLEQSQEPAEAPPVGPAAP